MSNQNFKSIVMSINLDFLLRNLNKGKERCARNIIEFGFSLSPKDNLQLQKDLLYNNLMTILETTKADKLVSEVKEWFTNTFLKRHSSWGLFYFFD